MAVGGYGRGELSPHSDVDLLLLTDKRGRFTSQDVRAVLYPLWDAGFQVGHALATPADAIRRADGDLHAATSLLSARLVAGDAGLFDELIDRRRRWIARETKTLVRRITESSTERHRLVDRAGWVLAPDIKEDVGGFRDFHALGWLNALFENSELPDEVVHAYELLMAVREALHAEVKRKLDRVRIDLQPKVAMRLGLGDRGPDALMTEVHSAARTIEFEGAMATEAVVQRALGGPRRSGVAFSLGGGIRVDDGLLQLDRDASDVAAAVRLLATHATTGRKPARSALQTIIGIFDRAPLDRWDDTTRDAFFELLAGEHAHSALELLDHTRAWPVLMPEWSGVRGLAQHDHYHRYTVDAHSFRTVAEVTSAITTDQIAASAAEEAGEIRTLYLAALLHDAGKGSGEDHSVAGERLARRVCGRMGLDESEAEEVAALVRRHLFLADTATRRDLDDGSVIDATAKTIKNPRLLRLLYPLTVADGRATGPESWSEWKAALIRELYRKTLIALETGEIPIRNDAVVRARQIEAYEPALAGRAEAVLATLPPSYVESVPVADMVDEVRLLLQAPKRGEVRFRIDEGAESGQAVVTVCAPDRPGTLARAAGVLALNRISVLRAQAYSTSDGFALERFVVGSDPGTDWERFKSDLAAAYSGKLAVEAHLERKARDYRPGVPVVPEVRILQDASEHSTVVEVRAPDALGLLYAIASGLSDLDIDIHVAKIDTLGSRVVDVFYVRTLWGGRLDEAQAGEVEKAVGHRIRRLFGHPAP